MRVWVAHSDRAMTRFCSAATRPPGHAPGVYPRSRASKLRAESPPMRHTRHTSRRGQRRGACASAVHPGLLAILPSGGTSVPFTVDDFGDLLRLLDQHPEWRSELRRHVLTDELLELPALMRRLAERVDRLAQTQERTAEQLSALTARVDA